MRRMSPVDLANYIITMLREEIAAEADQALVRKYRSLLAAKRPFTKAELAEAIAELDEEANAIDYHSGDWIAYCITCRAAVKVDDDHRIVLAEARTHARRFPAHQVIAGWALNHNR